MRRKRHFPADLELINPQIECIEQDNSAAVIGISLMGASNADSIYARSVRHQQHLREGVRTGELTQREAGCFKGDRGLAAGNSS
jgi:hypothetical protein